LLWEFAMPPLALGLLLPLLLQAQAPASAGSFGEVIEERPLPGVKDAELLVEAQDTGATPAQPLPVRVIVTASDGGHPDGSGHGVYADGRFFADGRFTVRVPPGPTRLQLRSGPNYIPLDTRVEAKAGTRVRLRAALHRWFAPEGRGWYGGDNHVHAQHDARAAVKTGLAYTALQARANGLSFLTEAGSDLPYDALGKLDTKGFLFRYANELRPGPFVGHLNTPGIRHPLPEERYEQLVRRPLPALALTEAVHELGGAVIRTHPLTPPYQLHWMGATEALSDGALGRCADAFDLDSPATERLWFALLNLGNRLAASGSTDAALGRLQTPSPGDRRVYCHAGELTYPALVKALRAGRTFATNGGPVFPFFRLDGCGPGETVKQPGRGEHKAEAEVRALYPLKKAELYRRGQVVKAFEVAGKKGEVRLTHRLRENGPGPAWYVLRVEDERGHWAITSPVYVEPARPGPRPFASALVLEVSNHTRFIELRRQFFAHVLATVSPDDALAEVRLLRDGKAVHALKPEGGNRIVGGKVPVTALRGEYRPGWVWHREGKRVVHFQADWPVQEGGWYAVQARTAKGRVLTSDAVHFDAQGPNSRALSVAHLRGGDTEFTLWGYGEEMPLADIRLPLPGDHWWYPQNTFWRVRTAFGGQVQTLTGGPNGKAPGSFRAIPAEPSP
jgi:hypothetical protein